MSELSSASLLQMAGGAGRPGLQPEGRCCVLAPEREVARVQEMFLGGSLLCFVEPLGGLPLVGRSYPEAPPVFGTSRSSRRWKASRAIAKSKHSDRSSAPVQTKSRASCRLRQNCADRHTPARTRSPTGYAPALTSDYSNETDRGAIKDDMVATRWPF